MFYYNFSVETKRRKSESQPTEMAPPVGSDGQQASNFAAAKLRTLKASGMTPSHTNPILNAHPDSDLYPFAFA